MTKKKVIRKVNGVPVRYWRVYPEGGYWRWKVVDDHGKEYVDGGNYLSREQAQEGLRAALRALQTA